MSTPINYSGQQKIAILREHLVENVPVSEVCKKHDISVANFYNWQRILFEEGATLFEQKPNASNVRRQEAAAVKQVQELEAAVTRKNEVIAEFLKQHYANGRSAAVKRMSTTHGYPERYHRTVKSRCLRPVTSLSIEDARRAVDRFVNHYNTTRLHSAIGYVTPLDMPEGSQKSIPEARDRKLEEARLLRGEKRRQQ
jgi:transposase-like protein